MKRYWAKALKKIQNRNGTTMEVGQRAHVRDYWPCDGTPIRLVTLECYSRQHFKRPGLLMDVGVEALELHEYEGGE